MKHVELMSGSHALLVSCTDIYIYILNKNYRIDSVIHFRQCSLTWKLFYDVVLAFQAATMFILKAILLTQEM